MRLATPVKRPPGAFHAWPAVGSRRARKVLSPVAVHHGYPTNSDYPAEENINERVLWSVIGKHQTSAKSRYHLRNLPSDIPADKIAPMTDEERELLGPQW
jgi:hypothetical protein